jgi:hypothetical protein
MPKAPELVEAFDDPDFGRIEYWRSHGRYLPNGHIFDKPYTSGEWTGSARLPSGRTIKLSFDGDFDARNFAEVFGARTRATYAALVADEGVLKQRIAAAYAAAIEGLDAAAFADSLTIDTVAFWRLEDEIGIDVWCDADESILGDHSARAMFDEDGALIEVE